MRPFSSVLLAVLLVAVPVFPTALARQPGGEHCASTLDCSAEEIEELAIPERLVFVRALQDRVAAEYLPEFRHLNSIQGVLRFFIDNDLGTPESWVSHVDAVLLEAVERGFAMALEVSDDDFGNPTAKHWADYLRRMRRGELDERWAHDPAWSIADQASAEHGIRLAEAKGVHPTHLEWNIYQFTELYRWIMRNPQPALIVLNDRLAGLLVPVDFVQWLTDATNPVPAYRGANVAYDLSRPDLVRLPVSMTQLLLAYAPELVDAYRADSR
ncbi:hypothetical protein [Saccharopolyspora taberi]|uniref:Uncharacterized protein n=1 Tax=Saccharopolyspora taberi TaxID=60895 RepID=A0ABN3UZZ6_9PSEU